MSQRRSDGEVTRDKGEVTMAKSRACGQRRAASAGSVAQACAAPLRPAPLSLFRRALRHCRGSDLARTAWLQRSFFAAASPLYIVVCARVCVCVCVWCRDSGRRESGAEKLCTKKMVQRFRAAARRGRGGGRGGEGIWAAAA